MTKEIESVPEDVSSDVPEAVQMDENDPLVDDLPDEIALEEISVTEAMKKLGTCRSNVMGMIARGTLRARKPRSKATGEQLDVWLILRMDVDAVMAKRASVAIQTLEKIIGPGKWVVHEAPEPVAAGRKVVEA